MKRLIATALIPSLFVSCSFFAPKTAQIKVIAANPQATLYVNGKEIGQGSAIATLPTNKQATFAGVLGKSRTDIVLDYELSNCGIADLSAGCFLLLPLLGFCSPGAWQLTQDTVPLHIPFSPKEQTQTK